MNKTNSITEIASDVPEMYSIRAGSSICDCENKIDCICLVEIKAENAQNYVYPEVAGIPDIYLHDKDGKGVLVELEVVSSGCVSKNDDDCPVATITSDTIKDPKTKALLAAKLERNQEVYKRFWYIDEQQQMLDILQSTGKWKKMPKGYDLGILLGNIIYDESTSVPHNRYTFSVSQCQNSTKQINFLKAISKELTELTDLPSPMYIPLIDENPVHTPLIKRSLSWLSRVGRSVSCDIYVFPKYEWSMDITLKTKFEREKLTEKERKKIAVLNKKAEIINNPNTTFSTQTRQKMSDEMNKPKSWTKMPTHALLDEYTIAGTINYQVGNVIYSAKTEELQQQFIQVKGQAKILQNTLAVFDAVNRCFAPDEEFKIVEQSILWPQLAVKLKRELEIVRHNNHVLPRFISTTSINAEPLLGYRIKIDLIQAFATMIGGVGGMELAKKVRELALKAKDNVQGGGNGAYVGVELNLLLSIQGDLGLTVKSDANTNYEWKIDLNESARLVGKIVARASVEAGAKFWFLKGYLDINGEVIAEGVIGFDHNQDKEGGVDIVVFHNGIVLKYQINYGVGESKGKQMQKSEQDLNDLSNFVITNPTKSNVKTRTWIVQEPLEKSKSNCRVTLS